MRTAILRQLEYRCWAD